MIYPQKYYENMLLNAITTFTFIEKDELMKFDEEELSLLNALCMAGVEECFDSMQEATSVELQRRIQLTIQFIGGQGRKVVECLMIKIHNGLLFETLDGKMCEFKLSEN